jgi:hypothetical protein
MHIWAEDGDLELHLAAICAGRREKDLGLAQGVLIKGLGGIIECSPIERRGLDFRAISPDGRSRARPAAPIAGQGTQVPVWDQGGLDLDRWRQWQARISEALKGRGKGLLSCIKGEQ